jgi:hypothetical protein
VDGVDEGAVKIEDEQHGNPGASLEPRLRPVIGGAAALPLASPPPV